jgi:hypothetical protein
VAALLGRHLARCTAGVTLTPVHEQGVVALFAQLASKGPFPGVLALDVCDMQPVNCCQRARPNRTLLFLNLTQLIVVSLFRFPLRSWGGSPQRPRLWRTWRRNSPQQTARGTPRLTPNDSPGSTPQPGLKLRPTSTPVPCHEGDPPGELQGRATARAAEDGAVPLWRIGQQAHLRRD